jgi:hypothetical protein
MRTTKRLACLGTLAVCLGVPTLGIAEENCSGHGVQVGSKAITTSNDPGLPGHPGIGYCWGGPQVGRCTYKDKDRDEWTNEWKSVPGVAGKYTWRAVSGTGKFANSTSSGWTQHTRKEGDVIISIWGGNCN